MNGRFSRDSRSTDVFREPGSRISAVNREVRATLTTMSESDDVEETIAGQCAFCASVLYDSDFLKVLRPNDDSKEVYAKYLEVHESWVPVFGTHCVAVYEDSQRPQQEPPLRLVAP